MATFNKFNSFVEACAEKVHNLGADTLTGVAAGLGKAYLLVAEVGTFVLTGINATLKASRLLTTAVGSFVLTGKEAWILASRLLTAEPGSFALTGIDATLTYNTEEIPVVKTKKHNKYVEQWWGQKCCHNYLTRHRH